MKRGRKNRRKAAGAAQEKTHTQAVVATFNSTVVTLVGTYVTTGSVLVMCGAGVVALTLVLLLMV